MANVEAMFCFCFSESVFFGGVGGTMPLTRVDCLPEILEGTDSVSEVTATAPLEFNAADEAAWRLAGGGTEVEAVKTGEESCCGRPLTIAGGEGVDWSSSSSSSPGPDSAGSAEHLASGWLDAAGLSF